MTQLQHIKLAAYYKQRHAQIAAYSRSMKGKLTHQEALDYAAIWQKYIAHKRASMQSTNPVILTSKEEQS